MRSLDEALRDPAFLEGIADLVVEAPLFPPVRVAHWACPCGDEPAKPGRATPCGTLVSLREPTCPFCGGRFREERRRAWLA